MLSLTLLSSGFLRRGAIAGKRANQLKKLKFIVLSDYTVKYVRVQLHEEKS